MNRREFIIAGSSAIALLLMNACGGGGSSLMSSSAQEIFPQGVASGDPTQDGIVLWTRINPEVHQRFNQDLQFYIAEDEDFRRVVLSGNVAASRINSGDDHTVKVILDGVLQPGRRYYYRFVYAGVASQTGRFYTLPAGSVPETRIGVVVCQSYEEGFYPAYRHLAREDLLFVVHLGDAIYEQSYGNLTRRLSLPSGSGIAMNLQDYRYLYRTYLSDPFYQLARISHAFVYTWDDHEFVNDYYYDYQQGFWDSQDHPYKGNKERMLALKRDSIKAWLEYTPVRAVADLNNPNPLRWIRIYRDLSIGNLAHLIVTDERSYRSMPPCGVKYLNPGCQDQTQSAMLGQEQLNWFFEKLSEGNYRWKLWANEVMFSQLLLLFNNQPVFLTLDSWDGYLGERLRIIKFYETLQRDNLIVLTGDLHATLVSEVRDYTNRSSQVVGVEFVTPAISSSSLAEGAVRDFGFREEQIPQLEQAALALNPWIKYANSRDNGYMVVSLYTDRAECSVFSVNKRDPNSEKRLLCRFRYASGQLEQIA